MNVKNIILLIFLIALASFIGGESEKQTKEPIGRQSLDIPKLTR